MSQAELARRERAQRAGAAIETILRRRVEALSGAIPDPGSGPRLPSARVDESPAAEIPPMVWVVTRTDVERKAMIQDATLEAALRGAMMDNGYPTLDQLSIVIGSQETRDRDAARDERADQAKAIIKPILRRHAEALLGRISEPSDGEGVPHPWFLESLGLVMVVTRTDAERDALKRDRTIADEVRAALRDSGHPSEGAVNVEFESQETVDTRYDGSWWYRLK